MTTNEEEYAAAVKRAQAKGLIVTERWDQVNERACWLVVNPKSGSIHVVYITTYGHLACDCESRKYCCCRAATREYLRAAKDARDAQMAALEAAAKKRDSAILINYAPVAFSLFKQ